ncbi:MAG: heparin lyase I family protein [Verrucomicrobiota bacterium]
MLDRLTVLLSLICLAKGFAEEAPELKGELSLSADLKSGVDAYTQIQEAFGKHSIESPDLYPENHPGFEHIRIKDDPEVGGCFKFFLHRDLDGDRDTPRAESDRQRNEIKGYSGSPAVLKATLGQTARYRWKFRISEDMTVTRRFCHFFQLKGVGGDHVGDPLLTLSASTAGGQPFLQLRYWPEERVSAKKFPIAEWSSVKGKWLQCECLVTYRQKGRGLIQFVISTLDGKLLFRKELTNANMWRPAMDFVRPKWGIYRSLGDVEAIRNEEDVAFFADFLIQEWSAMPEIEGSKQGTGSASD